MKSARWLHVLRYLLSGLQHCVQQGLKLPERILHRPAIEICVQLEWASIIKGCSDFSIFVSYEFDTFNGRQSFECNRLLIVAGVLFFRGG